MKLSVSFIDNGRVSRQSLTELFENYGDVVSVKIFRGMTQSHGRVLAFVEMKKETEGEIAKELLDRTEFEGTQLRVSFSQDKVHTQRKSPDPSYSHLMDEYDSEDRDEAEQEEELEEEFDKEEFN